MEVKILCVLSGEASEKRKDYFTGFYLIGVH
jgi:hypothetical protein